MANQDFFESLNNIDPVLCTGSLLDNAREIQTIFRRNGHSVNLTSVTQTLIGKISVARIAVRFDNPTIVSELDSAMSRLLKIISV